MPELCQPGPGLSTSPWVHFIQSNQGKAIPHLWGMMEWEKTSFMSVKRLLFGLLSAVSMLNFPSEWWH